MDYSEATFWYLVTRDLGLPALLVGLFALGFLLAMIERIGRVVMRRVRASRRRPRGGTLMGRPVYLSGEMPSSRAPRDGER